MAAARDLPSSDSAPPPPVDAAKLIADHQVGIWRYLRALGCDVAEADDLTQETFLAVLQRPFVNYNAAATVAYLRKVAYNRFVSARRRSGRMVLVDQLEELDQAWSRLAGDDAGEALLEALKVCLEQLTERAKMSLLMRFRDRVARTEIAEALQITEHGAKNLMQRAKKQLRACIEGRVS